MFLKRRASVKPRRSRFQSFLLLGGLVIALVGGCGPLFAATGGHGSLSPIHMPASGPEPTPGPAGPQGCAVPCNPEAAHSTGPAPCDAAAVFERCPQPDVSAKTATVTRIPVLGAGPDSRAPTDWLPGDVLYLQFNKLLI